MKKLFLLSLLLIIFVPKQILAQVSFGFNYPVCVPSGSGCKDAQDFGKPNSDFGGKFHLGEDWNKGAGEADTNELVHSIANGTVRYSKDSGQAWGRVVIIEHQLPDGASVYSQYGHLNSKDAVSEGTVVNLGDVVGTIRHGVNQPFKMSAHLHFEIRTDSNPDKLKPGLGYSVNPKPAGWVDPSEFIDSHRQIVTPPTAVSVNISQKDYQSAKISWTKNESPYFLSYKLFRLSTEADTNPLLLAELNTEVTTEFIDSNLKQNTDYFYEVDVCNIANQCTSSQIISTKTDKDPNYVGKVVYSSKVDNLFQIHLIDGIKENVSRLRTSSSNDYNSKWSPDGKKIMFDSIDVETKQRQIFMMDKNGSNEVRITNFTYGAEQADWMPDGKSVIFRGFNTTGRGLFIQNIGKQDEKLITPTNLYTYDPSISSDGKLVFYNADYTQGRDKGGLFVTEIETGATIQLTASNDYNVDVSPKNSIIAYVSSKYSKNNSFSDICYSEIPSLMDKGAITEHDTSDSNIDPSFSNDGSKIIYSTKNKNTPHYELSVIDLDTSEQTVLTNNDVDDIDADIWIE